MTTGIESISNPLGLAAQGFSSLVSEELPGLRDADESSWTCTRG